MTESVTPTSGGAHTTSGTQGATGTSSHQVTVKTTFSSVADLQAKAPKEFMMFMQGIAMGVVSQIKRQQDHLKETMRNARRDAGIH